MADDRVREAVGVFHDEKSLRSAADELMISGFDRSSLSLLASRRAVEKQLGRDYRRVAEVEDDAAVPHIAYVGTDSRVEAKGVAVGALFYVGAVAAAGSVVASGGTIGAALIAAGLAGGAGGLVGGALARFIDRRHARYIQDQLDRGAIALWVRTESPAHERRAVDILERWSAADVHVHDLPKAAFDYKGGVSYDLSFIRHLFNTPPAHGAGTHVGTGAAIWPAATDRPPA
jgi:hypothetical protein